MARKRYTRRRSKGRFAFLYKLLAFVVTCTAIALALTLFFRIRTINVSGNSRYDGRSSSRPHRSRRATTCSC